MIAIAITAAPRARPVTTPAVDEPDSAGGAFPGAAPAGVVAPDDPGFGDDPGEPGEVREPDGSADDRADVEVGLSLGEALGVAVGLARAPGMPTDVSSATTFPAVQDEWPPATSRQVLPITWMSAAA